MCTSERYKEKGAHLQQKNLVFVLLLYRLALASFLGQTFFLQNSLAVCAWIQGMLLKAQAEEKYYLLNSLLFLLRSRVTSAAAPVSFPVLIRAVLPRPTTQ